jgi:ribonuclease-3
VARAAAFAERLGLPVRDLDLLDQALVHSSYLHEHPAAARGHNERLEFLGDAVVNLVLTQTLFARHPDDDEGMLSARRAAIVSSAGLAKLANRLGLGELLYLGEGEAARGGRRRPSLLASSFEALVGAIYLDLGWEASRDWLVALAEPELTSDRPASALKSPKSRLQEHTQRTTGGRPSYHLLDAVGPDHEKRFRIEVSVGGEVLGRGEGLSRREAETAAAAEALERVTAAQKERARRPRRRTRTTRSVGAKPPEPLTSPPPEPAAAETVIAGAAIAEPAAIATNDGQPAEEPAR